MIIYTVYSNAPIKSQSTQDPAEALRWARAGGDDAFVTRKHPGHGAPSIVWTPAADRHLPGGLLAAVIDTALAVSKV